MRRNSCKWHNANIWPITLYKMLVSGEKLLDKIRMFVRLSPKLFSINFRNILWRLHSACWGHSTRKYLDFIACLDYFPVSFKEDFSVVLTGILDDDGPSGPRRRKEVGEEVSNTGPPLKGAWPSSRRCRNSFCRRCSSFKRGHWTWACSCEKDGRLDKGRKKDNKV